MENNYLYQIFNNATIAAILAVGFGAWVASYQYKKQKDIDRLGNEKRKIVDLLSEIYQAAEEVLFIYDRATRTLLSTRPDNSEFKDKERTINAFQEQIDYMKIMEETEIPRISLLINEKIPLLDKKITSYLNLYFSSHKNLVLVHEKFNNDLKKWHDFVINGMGSERISFLKYSNDIEQMSLKDFKKSTNELIKIVSKIG